MKKCTNCGTVLSEDSKVCVKCGCSVLTESMSESTIKRIYD